MRNYVIFLQGENFTLEVDGKIQPAGFFATRRVEAETEDDASNIAKVRLLAEPELEGNALPDYSLEVKVAHEMPLEHKVRYSVFVPYAMEEE